MNAKDKEKEK